MWDILYVPEINKVLFSIPEWKKIKQVDEYSESDFISTANLNAKPRGLAVINGFLAVTDYNVADRVHFYNLQTKSCNGYISSAINSPAFICVCSNRSYIIHASANAHQYEYGNDKDMGPVSNVGNACYCDDADQIYTPGPGTSFTDCIFTQSGAVYVNMTSSVPGYSPEYGRPVRLRVYDNILYILVENGYIYAMNP